MTNKYRGIKEGEESWICKPNNGGDLGDVFDIADELNRLSERVETLEKALDRIIEIRNSALGSGQYLTLDSIESIARKAKDTQ